MKISLCDYDEEFDAMMTTEFDVDDDNEVADDVDNNYVSDSGRFDKEHFQYGKLIWRFQ